MRRLMSLLGGVAALLGSAVLSQAQAQLSCPALEGLEITDVTIQGATISWENADVDHYTVSYGLAAADGYAESIVVENAITYTITGLKDDATYKVKVVGYCDALGQEPSSNALEGEFTTLEACHTPKNFTVKDVTYYGATFSSTAAEQKENTLDHRLIHLEDANDANHVHIFKQTGDSYVATVHHNRSVIAKTRAVCARGDSSAWSAPITFTTPFDPTKTPDTFDIAIKVNIEAAGTAAMAEDKTRYLEDSIVTMIATPNLGYRFVEWLDKDGRHVSFSDTIKWTAMWEGASDSKTHHVAFTAVFVKQYTIVLVSNQSGTTGAFLKGAGTYDEGTEVTLEIMNLNSLYVFDGWRKSDGSILSLQTPYTFTPTESDTITALFHRKQYYELNVAVVPDAEWGSVDFSLKPERGNNGYREDRVVTMTAAPVNDNYYKFLGWVLVTDNPSPQDTVSRELSYTVATNSNKSFKAVFAPIQYKVTLVSNPSKDWGIINGTSGQPSDGGWFNAGSTRKLTARPQPGFEFVKWMSGDEVLAGNPGNPAVFEYKLLQDTTITAYFKEKNPLLITVNKEPDNEAGSVTGAGEIQRGEDAVLTATPAAHYAFKEWRRLDGNTSTANPYTIDSVVRDWTLTAVFRKLNNYTIAVETVGSGTVTGAGTYEEGSQVTLTATPDTDEHYEFSEWLDADGEHFSSEATLSFTATADVTLTAMFTKLPQYTVDVRRYVGATSTPGAGEITMNGEEKISGAYYKGTKVKLEVVANHGYTFVEWQKNTDPYETVSTANPWEFTPSGDVTYRAVFKENIRIDVVVAPQGAGTVTGAGLYDTADLVKLTATADATHVFVEWRDGETVLSDKDTLTFMAAESKNITARFRDKKRCSLTVTSNNEAAGSVSVDPKRDEDNKYQEGTEVTLTAAPKDYYRFVAWVNDKNYQDTLGKEAVYKITMNQDTAVRAIYQRIRYKITLVSSPSTTYGTIRGTSGSTVTGIVEADAGSTRNLKAEPRAGYEFVKWMGGTAQELGKNIDLSFVLTQDTTITAYFKEKQTLTITLNVSPEGAGTATGAGTVARHANAALKATPAPHYAFVKWQRLDGGTQSTRSSDTLKDVVRDWTLTAVFRELDNYTVTVTHNTGGTVTKDGTEVTAPILCEEGSTVTLTAEPQEGYAFTSWTVNGTAVLDAEATHTFTPTGNVTINAVFTKLDQFHVTLYRYYDGKLTPEAGTLFVNNADTREGDFYDGTEITIKAEANKGYHFVEWRTYDGFDFVATDNPYTFSVTEKIEYWAVFEANVRIDVTVAPEGAGTVTGAGLYDEDDPVVLTAKADDNHVFVGWKEGETILSDKDTLIFTAMESRNLTAVFRDRISYHLEVEWDDDLGSVEFEPTESDDKKYPEGTRVKMTAKPAEYCKFVGWQNKNDHIVSTELTHWVTIERDTFGTALFERIQYNIELKSEPEGWGSINGTDGHTSTGGTFEAGSLRKLEAVSEPGYVFAGWKSGTEEKGTLTSLGDTTRLHFILTQDTTITAYFVEKNPLLITLKVEPADAGTVTGGGEVARHANAALKATPAPHYVFEKWQRLDNNAWSTRSTDTLKDVVRDWTLTAVFRTLENYTVTVSNTEGGKITDAEGNTVSGEKTYEEDSLVTLVAVADAHYAFTRWEINGEDAGSDPELSFRADGTITTVHAVFTKLPEYTVTVNRYVGETSMPTAGTININGRDTIRGTFEVGTEVSLTATHAKGYRFVGWKNTADGTVVEGNLLKFNIAGNVTYRALFEENIRITVNTYPEGEDVGEVTGEGLYDDNDEVMLTATADEDYVFVEWRDADGNTLAPASPAEPAKLVFTATESKTITAVFRIRDYFKITVPILGGENNEDHVGSVSIPGGEEDRYQEGRTIEMTAVPAPYCEFVEWRDKAGNKLSEEEAYSFVISQDTTFYAVFRHLKYTVTLKRYVGETETPEAGTIIGVSGSETTGGTFNGGTERRLEAKPASGYLFEKWVGSGKSGIITELGTDSILEYVVRCDTTITAVFKEKPELNITVTVDPELAGTVTGDGKIQRGKDAVLTAKANPAYKFLYWVNLAGDQIEANPDTLKNVTRDYTFVAQFRAKYQYDITVIRVPNDAAGSITRTGFLTNGKAREDTTVTLTATAAMGYMFVGWQDADGKQLSTEATFTFKATADAIYKAVFELIPTPEYTVKLKIDPEEGGSVRGGGVYEEGQKATITATPDHLYRFDGWYDAAGTKVSEGTTTIYEFEVTGDVTYTARFIKRNTVDVNVTVRLGETAADETVGTVEGAGEYAIGENVTLTATPASDEYVFSGWRDINNDDELIVDADGNAVGSPFTFTATKSVNYAAVFREEFEVKLNIDPDEHAGTVTGAGFYKETATATITATAHEGYVFTGWFDEDNQEVSIESPYIFTVEGNVTYTAKFVTIDEEHRHTIRVSRLPNAEAGTATGAGRYLHGAKDTLRATAAANYLFVAWLQPKADDPTQYDTVSKLNPYIFEVTQDVTYTALFRSRAHYTIELDVLPNDNVGAATLSSTGAVQNGNRYDVREGRTVTLQAMPVEGYTFVAWRNPSLTAPGDTVARNAIYTFVATGNVTYHAIFRRTPVTYKMTLNVTPTAAGTVEGEGDYHANASVTITAKPNPGYVFVGWRNLNGEMVSDDATHTFNITRNTTYTAVFKATNQVYVKLEVTPAGAGTVEGHGIYAKGDDVTITATANRGYRFVEWQNEDGDTKSYSVEYKFKAETDVTYTAVFTERPLVNYTVMANVLPNDDGGKVEGTGTFVEGTMVTLTAVPAEGYVFVKWQDADGVELGAEITYTFELSESVTYTAVFEEIVKPKYTVTLHALPDEVAGMVTGEGVYEEGTPVTIAATANEGYRFVKWQDEDGKQISGDATHTFEITENVTYSALFEEVIEPPVPVYYTVELNILPDSNIGTVTGEGIYEEGETVTITATANEGYAFVKWQDEDGRLISSDATHTFEATADVEYTALFKEIIHEKIPGAAFNVWTNEGCLHIENVHAVTLKDVLVVNTSGKRFADFSPNTTGSLVFPLNVRCSVLVVRLISEVGTYIYKVYIH